MPLLKGMVAMKTNIALEGQVSIFDIKITEKPKKVTENKHLNTKINESYTNINVITEQQQQSINKYKLYENINRIIHYGGGGIGIELKDGQEFQTIYVNKQGIEEFKWDKQIRILDMDNIIFATEIKKSNIVNKVEVGDYVKANYGRKFIEGTISREYGMGNEILNIRFSLNGKNCETAIGRKTVVEIIRKGMVA